MRFDSYHPFINLIYFVAVIAFSICFNHPVFVCIAYVCAFAYSIKLNGKKQVILNVILIPLILAYTAWYSYYNHFGVTNLHTNLVDNQITLEALLYGLQKSVTVATVIMLVACLFTIFSTDKIIYLFGKLSPKLSLFISILLRCIPRVKRQATRINTSQKGIGRSPGQRGFLGTIVDFFREASITITWTLENFVESAASMKSRGYSLRGRTAFSIYRFDNRDRSFVVTVFFCLVMMFCAFALNQTNMHYNPELVMTRVAPVSLVFYFAYAFLFLLPMGLQIIGEAKFKRLRNNIE